MNLTLQAPQDSMVAVWSQYLEYEPTLPQLSECVSAESATTPASQQLSSTQLSEIHGPSLLSDDAPSQNSSLRVDGTETQVSEVKSYLQMCDLCILVSKKCFLLTLLKSGPGRRIFAPQAIFFMKTSANKFFVECCILPIDVATVKCNEMILKFIFLVTSCIVY